MKEYLPYLPSAAIVLFIGIVVKMINGNVKKMNNDIDNKVSRKECHIAQEGIKQRIDDLDKHLTEKFDMLIDLTKKNAK